MTILPAIFEPKWKRYPLTCGHPHARRWIRSCAQLGLANNTISAYAFSLEGFLNFCRPRGLDILTLGRAEILEYLAHLRTSVSRRTVGADTPAGNRLSNATLHQRLTAVRLFFQFLVEDEVRTVNPVKQGRYSRSMHQGARGLLPVFHKLPWIPSEEQWAALLAVVARSSIRNRCMLAFAYDAALRREELCQLRSDDIDPAQRVIRIRAENTKSRRERILPYSEITGTLLRQYLRHRSGLSRQRGPLFLSESPRNFSASITLWTWSKVVRAIALQAGVPDFSTHTLRHLCLTDLARAGWGLHEISQLAGHRSLETTKLYVHLSARDLSQRFQATMDQVHAWRLETLSATAPSSGLLQ